MSRTVSAVAAFTLALCAFSPCLPAADTASVDALMQQAKKAMDDGKYKAALAALDAAITEAPGRADLYGMRAKVNDERNDLDKALADAQKMIDLAPNSAEGYIVRAHINMGREKWDEAMADANTAIAKEPKSADAYYLRSDIYSDMGKDAESKADDAKARALDK